ncbi:hypothetical protein [Peribacillus sp. SCS-37]|uniref:hypothetical protein n=1 Tax=Paraperibacillus esterisolvens TaxID=3115296 RepID=UPI003905F7F9
METFNVFGTFYGENGNVFRKYTYQQFGTSHASISSTIMLNPGKARLKSSPLVFDQNEKQGK